MEKHQIIELINKNIDYSDLQKAEKLLSKSYEIKRHKFEAEDIKNVLYQHKPVAIPKHLIIGYSDLKKAFEDSDGNFFEIERPVESIVIEDEFEDNREYFAILGKDEWGQGKDIESFYQIISPLRVGEIYLPSHSAIFNFLNPTEQQIKEKIQSFINGVTINILQYDNYIDNCLHEIGHLFWKTCVNYEEKQSFKELFKYLKPSAIYEWEWEKSSEQEVFCTIYKWYLKSILINQSFYNILKHEEPKGLELLQSIFERKAKDRLVNDIWDISKDDLIEYLNPKYDKTTGKYFRKSGLLDKIKDIELPEHIINDIQSVQEGVPYIALGKAIVPVCGNMIDFEKARDLSKLTRKQITDKRGHIKTVWVKTNKEEKKEEKSQTDIKKYENNIIARPIENVGLKYGDKLPENVFLHGSKRNNSDVIIDETKTFYATKDWSIAENYANSGIKAIQLKSNAKVLDLNTEKGRERLADILREVDDTMDKEALIEDFKKISLHQLGISDNVDYANILYDYNIDAVKDTEGNLDVTNNNCLESYIPEKNQPMQKAVNLDKPLIYLDMDGVVTWFSEAYKQAFNRDVFGDDSFTVTQFCLTDPYFFRNIPVLQKGKDLYDKLSKKYQVIFLTTPMEGMEYCKVDKIAWLKENICENPTVIFSDSKGDYANSAHDILIDDMSHNLSSFSENGGTAIDFNKYSADEIIDIIQETLNPQREIQEIKRQIKDMQVNVNPTEKQKESGVYKKGRVVIKGIPIVIENPKGSVRWGIGIDGLKWRSKMYSHYGYIQHKGDAVDGDKIDVFIGDNFNNNKVFVINQGRSGMFDEHKIMLGYNNINEAKEAYLRCYEKNWERNILSIVPTNTRKLKDWLKSGNLHDIFRGDM